MSQVKYLDYVIDEQGLHPTEKKIQAIKEASTPTNVTELRAFLGIINYYGKVLLNLSSHLAHLHEKNAKWKWNMARESAYQSAKNALQANSLLVHFDSFKPLILACGFIFTIFFILCCGRPHTYASRTLSAAEKNYSKLEKEGLAVVYGVKKFHNYLYGHNFFIESDHQPLSHLFNEKK